MPAPAATKSALFAADLARHGLRFAEAAGLEERSDVGERERPRRLQGNRLSHRRRRRFGLRAVGSSSRGGHRVQRVPPSPRRAKAASATSACTAAALPEPDAAEELTLDPERAAHRHLCASGRRRPARQQDGQRDPHHASADRPRRRTPGRPFAAPQQGQGDGGADGAPARKGACSERTAKEAATRKGLIGSGDRSDRIRTYNFPQNRLTDHRINLTLYKLQAILDGDLGEVIAAAAGGPGRRATGSAGKRPKREARRQCASPMRWGRRANAQLRCSMRGCCWRTSHEGRPHPARSAHDDAPLDADLALHWPAQASGAGHGRRAARLPARAQGIPQPLASR